MGYVSDRGFSELEIGLEVALLKASLKTRWPLVKTVIVKSEVSDPLPGFSSTACDPNPTNNSSSQSRRLTCPSLNNLDFHRQGLHKTGVMNFYFSLRDLLFRGIQVTR
jgi:hypothetical protein